MPTAGSISTFAACPRSGTTRPRRSPRAWRQLILAHRETHAGIFVAYGDCGTGGTLDRLLEQHGIERLPGAHCYAFFAGQSVFDTLADDELGSFYLTDYLARNFERLILDQLGIHKHPELRKLYFAHYRRVVYLAQSDNPARLADARHAADALGLPLHVQMTGLTPLEQSLLGARAIVPMPQAGETRRRHNAQEPRPGG